MKFITLDGHSKTGFSDCTWSGRSEGIDQIPEVGDIVMNFCASDMFRSTEKIKTFGLSWMRHGGLRIEICASGEGAEKW